ncbi:hypothetical protein ACC775_38355, partial [Rhizobium ruizarguesonis]
ERKGKGKEGERKKERRKEKGGREEGKKGQGKSRGAVRGEPVVAPRRGIRKNFAGQGKGLN